MTKLTIVILSFNTKDLLLACLASIPKKPDWDIVVPDNGSTDGTKEALKKLYPKVKFIENGQNLGFAAGNNVALKHIKSDYVLLLNPDTVVMPKTIETVLTFMESNPKVGAATCRVELPDGQLDYSSHRGFPNPINSLLHFLGQKSDYANSDIPNKPHQIDSLTGAFALVRRSAGDQINWFDEDYFWNGEDIDLCYRLHAAGWQIYFLPQVKIIHYKGSSAKATKASRIKWAKNSTDVMAMFYKKHLAKQYPFLVNWLVYLAIKILYLIRLLKSQ